jgi:hypothetical protein
MIRKSGHRFSEKIMLKQKDKLLGTARAAQEGLAWQSFQEPAI